jgi:peptidoglycan/LPS O-acetylase OafA/YrhL
LIGGATDLVGLHFLGGTSPYSQPKYGFMLPESIGANITPSVFLGNVFFLQEITVSTLGSNGPLWSLTNEAWYYLAFPFLIALFLGGGGLIRKGLFGLLFVSIQIFLPFEIRSLGVVWLMGAAVSAAPARKMPAWIVLLTSTAFAATLLAASAGVIQGIGKDYFQGAVFAAVLYVWLPHLNDAASAPARKVTGFFPKSRIRFTCSTCLSPSLLPH